VLLQVARQDPRARNPGPADGTLDSYVFEVGRGLGLFVGSDLPPIKHATASMLAGAAVSADLVPRITVWRY
jgi:hypothetical protein